MKIKAAIYGISLFAAMTAAFAAEFPLKGTPFNGKWTASDTPRPEIEKPGWTLTFSDDFDGECAGTSCLYGSSWKRYMSETRL